MKGREKMQVHSVHVYSLAWQPVHLHICKTSLFALSAHKQFLDHVAADRCYVTLRVFCCNVQAQRAPTAAQLQNALTITKLCPLACQLCTAQTVCDSMQSEWYEMLALCIEGSPNMLSSASSKESSGSGNRQQLSLNCLPSTR